MQDTYIVKTNLGTITVSRAAICRVIENAVEHREGKVTISNKKAKPSTSLLSRIGLGGNDDYSDVEIDASGEHISVKLYIIVRFGTSISKVTNELIDEIHDGIKKLTGKEPKMISATVVGTLSRQIAKRNIEVVKEYEN